jgi:polysaccharide export outer membrane protein
VQEPNYQLPIGTYSQGSARSLCDIGAILVRRWRFAGLLVGGLLLLCLLYCLIAPNQYEASASVALRTSPASALSLEAPEPFSSASILSAPVQQETLANVFRSDRLAWRVITGLKLYQAPAFMGDFASRFPEFHADAATPEARTWLLERFQKRLRVQTLPRTMLIQIRFRSTDAVLSAQVVNAIIGAYEQDDSDAHVQATQKASVWLQNQLKELRQRVGQEEQRLTAFQREHGLLNTPETLANGQSSETQHTSALVEVDEVSRQLVAASTARILREAEYRAATSGDPELVLASNPGLPGQDSNFATSLLQQIHARQSALDEEQSQLSIEDGPNFPRLVEIRHQLEELDRQKKAEDARLVEGFHSAWKTAVDREQLVRKNLDALTAEGMNADEAASQYAAMREETNASHDLYVRVLEKAEEAGLSAGIQGSSISVVDYATQPVKPIAPNLPLYLAITLFVGLWLAIGGVFLMEAIRPSAIRAGVVLLALLLAGTVLYAQAPTTSTSGLPTGVVRLPATQSPQKTPNPQQSPSVWDSPQGASQTAPPLAGPAQLGSPMPAPIGPGDSLDIAEFHTPEFHSLVRVAADGSVELPMIHRIKLAGMDEQTAARAIEAELKAQGMLLHPQVSVLVTMYAGQDVSVLGEVARPGVYPYTLHHRLLDLLSAASGLSPNAGRLVNIYHRDDSKTPHPVVLDPSGTDTTAEHNPELLPGDTVQVSRAGLVYVIGDVVRPGGFPVDPAQGLTVVQALALAWGTTPNAASWKALLIREQKSGRTITSLNLKRMIHGQEPDQSIHDRDILFVPDSAAKNLLNKAIEAAVQSAVGLPIYGVMVYSQWFNRPATTTSTPSTKPKSFDEGGR